MFWGWGRILGSFLGGPLGALGRPPGACKAKSVSRVCFNSVDAHDEDVDNLTDVGSECHPVATLHQPTFHQTAFPQTTFRCKELFRSFQFGTAFLRAGCDLLPIRFCPERFIQSGSSQTKTEQSELVQEPKEVPSLLKLLLKLSKSSVVRFSDIQTEEDNLAVIQSKRPGTNDTSENVVDSKIKSSENLKQIQTTSFVEVKTDKSENVIRSHDSNRLDEEMKKVEDELSRTKERMDNSLIGLRGLDLITDGHFEEGFELVTLAARRGDPESLYNLGVIYERGHGRKKNLAKAVRCYKAAANQNHPASFYNLSVIYRNGNEPDLAKADELMKKAAELGLPEALKLFDESKSLLKENSTKCNWCLENGWHDTEEPNVIRRSAEDQTSARDLLTLARAYQFGKSGMPKDKFFALELFRMAAQTLEEAQQGYLALYEEIQTGEVQIILSYILKQQNSLYCVKAQILRFSNLCFYGQKTRKALSTVYLRVSRIPLKHLIIS